MLRQVRTWATIASLGSTIRLVSHIGVLFRYYVIKTLDDEGVIKYLQEPRTYGEILAKFNYVDSDYSRAILDVVASDVHPVILKRQDGKYVRNPAEPLPTLEEAIAKTS